MEGRTVSDGWARYAARVVAGERRRGVFRRRTERGWRYRIFRQFGHAIPTIHAKPRRLYPTREAAEEAARQHLDVLDEASAASAAYDGDAVGEGTQ